jgi:uncharacterized protein RhaS with RHS repeats
LGPRNERFLSPDPLGFSGGDANLYRYAGNDPINQSDPSGLRPQALGGSSFSYSPPSMNTPISLGGGSSYLAAASNSSGSWFSGVANATADFARGFASRVNDIAAGLADFLNPLTIPSNFRRAANELGNDYRRAQALVADPGAYLSKRADVVSDVLQQRLTTAEGWGATTADVTAILVTKKLASGSASTIAESVAPKTAAATLRGNVLANIAESQSARASSSFLQPGSTTSVAPNSNV